MKRTAVIGALLLAGACGCSSDEAEELTLLPEQSSDPYWFLDRDSLDQKAYVESWDALPIESIKFFRGGGSPGVAPRFHCWLYSGGKAEFKGVEAVEKLGLFDGRVYLFDYASLCKLVEDFDVLEKMKEYPSSSSHAIMSQVKVKMKSGEEYVLLCEDYHAPVEIWAFCSAIENIATSKINWKAR